MLRFQKLLFLRVPTGHGDTRAHFFEVKVDNGGETCS